jgi:hypothetical protein
MIQDLWDMANWALTAQPGSAIGLAAVANGAPTEVRTRLLNSIASLKQGITASMVETIRADVKLAIASGWMPADLGGSMQDILDQLNG